MSDESTLADGDDAQELPLELERRLRLTISGYELLEVIGEGGQGLVYKARDRSTGDLVAIKVLHHGPLASEAARTRLLREAGTTQNLSHPSIVKVLKSVVSEEGHDCSVMPYVDGEHFDQLWKNSRIVGHSAMAPTWALRCFVDLCRVVQYAHEKGVVHRDLSPSNIIIDRSGRPHLLDFGLAWDVLIELSTGRAQNLSMAGDFKGKLAYASPEQASGRGDIDPRTDVYALGVILYQLLTGGAVPYDTQCGFAQAMKNILEAEPTKPGIALAARRRLRSIEEDDASGVRPSTAPPEPKVASALEAVVLLALSKEPGRRYSDAGKLADDLERYLRNEPTEAETAELVEAAAAATARLEAARNAKALMTAPKRNRRRAAMVPLLFTAVVIIPIVLLAPDWGFGKRGIGSVGVSPNGQAPRSKVPKVLPLTHPAPVPPPPADGKRVVDLLPLIDPARDAILGSWEMQKGELRSTAAVPWARCAIPYRPPEEYDFRMVFTTESSGDSVDLMLVGAGRQFLWKNDGWRHRSGFELINGVGHHDNYTTRQNMILEPGQTYECIVKVRNTSVEAYLDGKFVSRAVTSDYSEFSLHNNSAVPNKRQVAILAFNRLMTVHTAQIIELKGTGERTR